MADLRRMSCQSKTFSASQRPRTLLPARPHRREGCDRDAVDSTLGDCESAQAQSSHDREHTINLFQESLWEWFQ